MTQKEGILWLLENNGSMTSMDAIFEIGCTKAATRISELREEGYLIHGEMEEGVNRFGHKTRYMRYTLLGRPQ